MKRFLFSFWAWPGLAWRSMQKWQISAKAYHIHGISVYGPGVEALWAKIAMNVSRETLPHSSATVFWAMAPAVETQKQGANSNEHRE